MTFGFASRILAPLTALALLYAGIASADSATTDNSTGAFSAASALFHARWWLVAIAVLLCAVWGNRKSTGVALAAATSLILVAFSFVLGNEGPVAAAPQQAITTSGKPAAPQVYSVNYPLAWAAHYLAGEYVDVNYPIPAAIAPPFWKPSAQAIGLYEAADLVVLNGTGYSPWLNEASLSAASVLDTTAGISEQLLEDPQAALWLDPILLSLQVRALSPALADLVPAHSEAISERLVTLRGIIAKWNTGLHRTVKALEGAPLLFSSEEYDYLQQRYPINGRTVAWQPDEQPSQNEWQALESLLTEHPAQLMFWPERPLPQTEARLSALGVDVLLYRPQASQPATGDFASVMNRNVAAFMAAAKKVLGED